MVSAVFFNHPLHLLPRISFANQRRLTLHDLLLLTVRFRLTLDLPLTRSRSFAYNSIDAVHSSRSRQHQKKTPSTMATKSENLTENATEETDKGEEKKKEVTLPPPPEKPEPGDCCGSGCVRCVWDVYYEELDEYDKLCSSISGETKPC